MLSKLHRGGEAGALWGQDCWESGGRTRLSGPPQPPHCGVHLPWASRGVLGFLFPAGQEELRMDQGRPQHPVFGEGTV